jgi:hypothetical protein
MFGLLLNFDLVTALDYPHMQGSKREAKHLDKSKGKKRITKTGPCHTFKHYHNKVTKFKDNELTEMSDREFRSPLLKNNQ